MRGADALRAIARRTPLGRPRAVNAPQAFPPGHFYSPVADVDEVMSRREQVFDRRRRALPGIDPRGAQQLELLAAFAGLQADMPFSEQPSGELRYGFDNPFFSYGDGLVLHAVLRHFAPRAVVEVGSGWSSALMLDVNDLFLAGRTRLTFVEPYPERLQSLFREGDRASCRVLKSPVQDVADDLFGELGEGDLLFIDSTHVSRVGSDVNRLLLEVVPCLAPGVIVHVHDVFWPFEYPEDWVLEGRNWNENYLLRALLVGNPDLEILWFNSYLAQHHHRAVADVMPLWARNTGGSIYLRVR